ncbi:conjugal transfer protein TraN [Thauera sp. UPWRP]|nr:conjugal transfer protein TraN [Thauera sp. UPWRP]
MRRWVIWITLFCFVTTQTAAVAGPFEEGTAAGQAANPLIRGTVNAPSASSTVPGYTSTPPETAYYGQPSLVGSANARLTACATATGDPVCEAQRGAMTSANTPREAISPYDPAVSAARAIAANPATTLEDIATYYSGCQVDNVATPSTEDRVCRQYSGTSPHSCTRSLSVSVSRTSSCTPGNWFANAASGRTGLDVQCIPDRPASQQHFRVTDRGTPPTYFDLDMTTPLTFPRMVATLPRSGSWWWWGSGQNGLWVADNQCVGDSCRLTAMVAQEYRRVCTDGGGHSGLGDCALERPFLEVYGACPSGTQSGDNILPWWGWGWGWGGDISAFEASACYAPSATASGLIGYDVTGTVPGYFWTKDAQRPVVGWRVNPAYGSIPQMVLNYERPHTTVTETDRWDDQCPGPDAGGRCTVAGTARCVDGPATKEVNGASISRDCWRYETTLACAQAAATDECAPLIAAGCAPAGTVCRQMNAATGICEITENTYTCPVPPGNTVTATNCPANVFCLAGNCFNTSYTNDADFARSMSLMEAAREAGVYLDTDNMQVFKGEGNHCRDRLFKNCCYSDSAGAGMTNQSLFGTGSRLVYDVLMNADNREFLYQGMQALLLGGGFSGTFTTYGVTVAVNGAALPAGSAVLYAGDSLVIAFDPWSLAIAVVIYIVMSMSSCNEEEGKLAMKEGAGLCHKVGTWCSSCIRVFGKCVACIEHTTGKCCFNSKLARIVNEQGRVQVGKGWGSGKHPDCSGFTIAQLQRLDFAAMDLTEFYASIVPTLPNVGTIQGSNAARLTTCYYGQGKCQ